jgi:hypothetical protein
VSLARRGDAGSSNPGGLVASHAAVSRAAVSRAPVPGAALPGAALSRAALALLVALGALSLPSAHAEAPRTDAAREVREARARDLFKQGNRLIEQARYVDALDKFEAAYSAWQNPKIQLNIATTLRTLGRHAEALRTYREYLGSGAPTGERRAEVQAIIAGLEARVAHLTLSIGPEVQRLTLDGREVTRDAFGGTTALAVEPGHHALLAETAAGPQLTTFDVAAGERQRIELPVPEASAPEKALPDAAAAEDAGAARERRRIGVLTRLDIDGEARGVVGALGVVVPIGARFVASAGGLMGAHAGGWVGLEALLLEGPLTPTLGVSGPFFFVEGARFGVSGELGGRWALLEDRLFVMARAALVHFPKLPEGYSGTTVVPSIGSELRW